MVNRDLTKREREIYEMISDETDNITFWNIVDIVRRDADISRNDARKDLKYLHNR